MSSSSSMAAFVLFLYMVALSSLQSVSSSSSSMCHPDTALFIFSLQSQCPLSIFPHPPLQVNGNFIEKALTSIKGPGYTSVLFYASWCPFSPSMHSTFETLGSMFPQVEHLAVDQSSALPSVFSRYGIHSVPSILLVNQTSKMRYHGPKNLLSLVQFYRRTAGLEPIQYFHEDQQNILGSNEKSILHSLNSSSLTEISKTEPYLVFSILFLCFRVLLTVFPEILSRFKSFWFSYVPHLNLDIFGETSQMMVRVLHMIDVRRIWTKLRLCKTQNLHEGAKSARGLGFFSGFCVFV